MIRFLNIIVFCIFLLFIQGCYTQLKWFHSTNESTTNINSNFYNENDYLDYKSDIIYDNSLYLNDYNRFNRRPRNNFLGFDHHYGNPFNYFLSPRSMYEISYWESYGYNLGSGYGFYPSLGMGYGNSFYPPMNYYSTPNNQLVDNSNIFEKSSRNWDTRHRYNSNSKTIKNTSNLKVIRFSEPSITKSKRKEKNGNNIGTFGTSDSKRISKQPNISTTRQRNTSSRTYTSPKKNTNSVSSRPSNSSSKRANRRR